MHLSSMNNVSSINQSGGGNVMSLNSNNLNSLNQGPGNGSGNGGGLGGLGGAGGGLPDMGTPGGFLLPQIYRSTTAPTRDMGSVQHKTHTLGFGISHLNQRNSGGGGVGGSSHAGNSHNLGSGLGGHQGNDDFNERYFQAKMSGGFEGEFASHLQSLSSGGHGGMSGAQPRLHNDFGGYGGFAALGEIG